MPAPRANRFRGTRAPEGATGSTPGDRQLFQVPPPWPGITWGHDARCECSWAFRDGVMQVKVKSGACTVHVGSRQAELPLGPPGVVLLAAIQAGVVTQELYDAAMESWHAERGTLWPGKAVRQVLALVAQAAGEAGWLDDCGSHNGYNQHVRDKTPICTPCADAERDYSREAKRGQVRARKKRERAWPAAA